MSTNFSQYDKLGILFWLLDAVINLHLIYTSVAFQHIWYFFSVCLRYMRNVTLHFCLLLNCLRLRHYESNILFVYVYLIIIKTPLIDRPVNL